LSSHAFSSDYLPTSISSDDSKYFDEAEKKGEGKVGRKQVFFSNVSEEKENKILIYD
jgi:hypothetical protein